MDHIVIEHRIRKEDEGKYLSLPFDVPEEVEGVTVSYQYPHKSALHNIIDLGLEDEDGRFLGWSGSARESVTVGEHDATPGYLMGRSAGKMADSHRSLSCGGRGVIVTYELRFHRRQAQWLFGDFHIHSDASRWAARYYNAR